MDDLYLRLDRDYKNLLTFLEGEGLSQRLLRKAFREGRIFLEDSPATKTMYAKQGEWVRLIFEEEEISLDPAPFQQEILYEDQDLLVVNKESNLAIMPCRSHPEGTFANQVADYFLQKGIQRKIRLLGRLDRDTTGVMVVCKNPYALYKLEGDHTRDKTYEALVWGQLTGPLRIDQPIGMGDDTMVREVRPDGKRAITQLWPIESNGKFTRIGVRLETGRTHQIRCHLRHIGHPIVGDDLYGGGLAQAPGIFLHVAELRLCHPRTGEKMIFRAPQPREEEEAMLGLLKT